MSCSGTFSRDGSSVTRRLGGNTWQRIAYEFKEYARSKTPEPAKSIVSMWQQPTWGDMDKFLSVVPKLGIANAATLTNAFGCSFQAPKHLQIVRNACQHLDMETFNEVRRLIPLYIAYPINHPSELIWLLYPTTRSDAIFEWIVELELIADLATFTSK